MFDAFYLFRCSNCTCLIATTEGTNEYREANARRLPIRVNCRNHYCDCHGRNGGRVQMKRIDVSEVPF